MKTIICGFFFFGTVQGKVAVEVPSTMFENILITLDIEDVKIRSRLIDHLGIKTVFSPAFGRFIELQLPSLAIRRSAIIGDVCDDDEVLNSVRLILDDFSSKKGNMEFTGLEIYHIA